MAALYRNMKAGKLDTAKGCKLVWALGQIRDTLEVSLIEDRIAQLEEESRAGALDRRGYRPSERTYN